MRKSLNIKMLLLLATLLGGSMAPWTASALIVAIDDQASLVFRSDDCPEIVRRGSFSCFLWLRPEQAHDVRRRVLSLPGAVRLTLEPGSGVRAVTLEPGRGLDATAEIALEAGRWALIAVSLDRATNRLDIWAGSDGRGLAAGSHAGTPPGMVALSPAEPQEPAPDDPWALGAVGAERGVDGAYGLLVIRGHAVGEQDAREVWESRRYFAPLDHENLAAGGRMTGWADVVWMTGHAVAQNGANGGVGGTPEDRSAIVGEPLTGRNVFILNRPREPIGPYWSAYMFVRPIDSVSGFRFGSRLEDPYGGFFLRDQVEASLPPLPAAAPAPVARQLVTGPDRPLRVMVSANSRGIRGASADTWAGNYMHGFVQRNLAQVSGVALRPISLTATGGPWLGFSTAEGEPPSGGVRPLDRSDDIPEADFTRFFTATGSSSRAAGSAIRIDPGGFQSLRCGPVAGSLMRAEAPLICEAHVLRFPGSSGLSWRSDRAESQSADGLLGPPEALTLDTTRIARTLVAPDRVVDEQSIIIDGDWRGLIVVGDAAYIADGPGAGAVSIVSETLFEGGQTTIVFEHPFGAVPEMGSTMRFGAWSIETVTHEFAPVDPGDPRVWRGIRLEAADDGAAGVVALAVSAYRNDVSGFIFGAAGWGGHGYESHLDEAFAAATSAWMALSRADVWLQGMAQQFSIPRVMGRFGAEIRAALPDCEIVWLGETEHGNSTFEDWHRYILNEGPDFGAPALSLLTEPSIGSFLEQLADGVRADNVHYSAFGNRALADLWTEQLDLATADGGCARVDLDGDGSLSVFDFLEFANLFGAGDLRADFDGSGTLDVFDFLMFQSEFARCGG